MFSFLLTDVMKENGNLLRKVWKNTKDLYPKISKTKNDRLIMQSKCTECGNKTSIFVKEKETKWLLSNLEIKTTLSKIPLFCFECIKRNEIVN